jgi:hypothetical protein
MDEKAGFAMACEIYSLRAEEVGCPLRHCGIPNSLPRFLVCVFELEGALK